MSGAAAWAWLEDFLRGPAFLLRYPYYAALLGRLQPVADPSVRTISVSLHGGRYYLHVNPDYFAVHPEHLCGLLLHAVHHVVLGHLAHDKFRDPADPRLMTLAQEISANEHIEEPLPDPVFEWQRFKRHGLRAGQSTLERYRLLQAARAEIGPPDGRDGGGTTDDHGPWQRGDQGTGAAEQTRQLLLGAMTDAAAAEASTPPGTVLVARHLLAGRSPGQLLLELGGAPAPPEAFVDWRSALALFVSRTRAPVHTYARPSRRFPGRIGEVPGRAYAPRQLLRPHLLVAIDTSMSMSAAELDEVARQLGVLREAARITVVECDTEVQRTYAFTGALAEVRGRGGTDLRAVFAPALLHAVQPDGIIYFTDGQGPFPEQACAVPTMWVLSKPLEFACPWGTRAQMVRKAVRQTAGVAGGGRRGRRP